MKIKAKWVAAIVYAASIVLLSVILFILVEENDYFWVTYWFTFAAATVVFAVIFYYLSDAKRTFKEFPANAPYAYVALQYLVAEVVLAAGMWLICSATGLKLKYFISAELVLALVFGIRLVLVFGTKKYVVQSEKKADDSYRGWQALASEVKGMQQKAESLPQELRFLVAPQLKCLYESIRFADPVGSEQVAGLEGQIHDALAALRYELGQMQSGAAHNTERIMEIAENVKQLLSQRDDRLKTLKS